jgi:hypothetical protein
MRRISLLLLAATLAGAAATAPWRPVSASPDASAAQAAPSLKDAVPISNEHHHHLIIDNSYVKAYEVEVPAHEATLLHRHDEDYVYLVLGAADITNAVIGHPEVKAHLPDTAVNFVRGPIAHVAANVGDTPFRNITIELVRKQGDVKTYYPTVDAALADMAKAANADGSRDILETDELRVSATKIAPGKDWTAPQSNHPRLFMLIDKMKNLVGAKEPKAPTFPEGILVWVPGGKSWSLPNHSKEDVKLVWLDFKN